MKEYRNKKLKKLKSRGDYFVINAEQLSYCTDSLSQLIRGQSVGDINFKRMHDILKDLPTMATKKL